MPVWQGHEILQPLWVKEVQIPFAVLSILNNPEGSVLLGAPVHIEQKTGKSNTEKSVD